jgi:hypothetical protein
LRSWRDARIARKDNGVVREGLHPGMACQLTDVGGVNLGAERVHERRFPSNAIAVLLKRLADLGPVPRLDGHNHAACRSTVAERLAKRPIDFTGEAGINVLSACGNCEKK